jgi:hypothetical protein
MSNSQPVKETMLQKHATAASKNAIALIYDADFVACEDDTNSTRKLSAPATG